MRWWATHRDGERAAAREKNPGFRV